MPGRDSPVRYVLIIQSNIELGPKVIQFNIQFKIQSEKFIQLKNNKIVMEYLINIQKSN